LCVSGEPGRLKLAIGIDNVAVELEQLTGLVGTLLTLARDDGGRFPLVLAPVDPAGAIAHEARMVLLDEAPSHRWLATRTC
jgi:hypothetical protein